jgi:hypothetical protein
MQLVQCRIDGARASVKMPSKASVFLEERATVTRFQTRIFLGCIAGAISVLVFHQTTLQLFFWCGLAPQAAFRVAVVPPFNAPLVASTTFWGAVYGGLFAWAEPILPRLVPLKALAAGVFAVLAGWFVIRPLAGHHVAFDWHIAPMLRSAAAGLMWGLGVTLILPMLLPRGLNRGRQTWDRRHLAT